MYVHTVFARKKERLLAGEGKRIGGRWETAGGGWGREGGDENRWRNSVRNTEEKNKGHLLMKPNLVPPSHSSRDQPNAGAQTDRQTDSGGRHHRHHQVLRLLNTSAS